jgi:hypothetical protein
MLVKFWVALLLPAAISACSLPRPWLAPAQTAACDTSLDADDALLTVSFRLPDCREGRLRGWTYFRSERPQFSTTGFDLQTSDLQTSMVSSVDWNAELDRRVVLAGESPVIYIHGYFNSQDDAHRRALGVRALLCPRQTAADLRAVAACRPKRPVVALTWPSHDKLAKYTWDEANAEWAIDRAVEQILTIARRHEGTILVAHSMGNRILVATAMAAKNEPRLFGHLILAAPDVDRVQITELLKRKEGLGFQATIYASRKDQALSASWRAHGYPRAGDLSLWVSGRRPGHPYREINQAVVVDTTDVSAGQVAHAAFVQSEEGAADLCRVLAGFTEDGLKLGREKDAQYPGYAALISNPKEADDCSRLAKAAARVARG